MAKRPKKTTPQPEQRRTRFPLLIALLVLAGIGLLVGYRLWSERPAPTAVSAEVLALGETTFASSCAACHGAEGQGNQAVGAPALNGSMHAWHHSDEQLISQIRYGGVSMPAVGADWSDEEIAAVISYVKGWWSPEQRRSQQGTLGE